MSKLKVFKGIAEGAVAAVVALAGTAISHTDSPTESNTNYCVVHQDICPKVRDAVNRACAIADNNKIGYSFGNVRDGEYDCSGLVISAYRDAGIDVGNATYTGNMLSELTAHGFVTYEYHDDANELMVGDILLTEGHTEMYIGGGQNVGAHWDFDEEAGDSSGEEIDYGAFNEYTHNWTCVLRYQPKWYDWYRAPEISDNFYAFIEKGGYVLSSGGGAMHLEHEAGNEQQVWHFTKANACLYTVSNTDISGSYNLYQDDTGSIIFNISGSETACLTVYEDTIQTSDYDSCSDAQRFTIRPVSDPIMVEYDFGGSSCPIIEEHYGEPYSGTFGQEVITGFSGWYTEREGGEKIDTNKVTNPYRHTLYAHFDAVPDEHAMSHGGGRHDGNGSEDGSNTTEEADFSVQAEVYSDPNIMQTESAYEDEIGNPEPERTRILVDSVNLSRYAKTLNTVGNSVSFTLSAEAYPTNAEGRTIRFESSNPNVAKVDCNTGYVTAVGDGSCSVVAYAENGVHASCEVLVTTQYTTRKETVPVTSYEDVPESYNMECFVGRMAVGKVRQFFNYDISNMLASLNLDEVYGMWHHEHTFPASEVENAVRIYSGQQQGGSQNGTNACDATGYSMWYGDAYYIFFIKSVNYKTVETTTYQTKNTLIPVEYD